MVDSRPPERSLEEYQRELLWSRYHKHLKITDRTSFRVVPLELNTVQARLHRLVEQRRREEAPVRVIILKARREGISTYIQSRFAHRAFVTRTFHGITGAHEDKASQTLHGMTEQMYDELPDSYKPRKKTGLQGKRLHFTAGSTLETFTAGGGDSVGRSMAANALHCSEVAHWRDQKGTLTALLQLVPDAAGTWIFHESTADGIGDEFHKMCDAALNGEKDYDFFFSPWHEFPDYALSPERTLATMGVDPELTKREEALAAQGISFGQLAWRRWAIQNLCGGDPSTFDQEYPDSPEVAFLTSGRPYFAHELLEGFVPVAPSRVGSVEGDPIRGGSELSFEANDHGPLRIWSVPKPGREYVIFGDVAGKVTADTHDARPTGSKADYCAASVVDRETGEQVAAYHAHIDPDLYGFELAKIGWLYQSHGSAALLAVENTGGYGTATIATLYRQLSYPNLYVQRALDTQSGKWSETIGFNTSESTRPVMLSTLRSMLRDKPAYLKDEGLKREMRTFVVHPNGKPAAQNGAHDDRVMSHAGALEVWREHAQRPLRTPAKKQKVQRSVESLSNRAPRVTA